MRGRCIFLILIAILIGSAVTPVAAQGRDELEAIVRKDKLTAGDRATIETVVNQRAKKLLDAAGKPKPLREARDVIIATSRVDKATAAGLEAYAGAVTQALTSSVGTDDLSLGLEITQILIALDHAQTSDALAAALSSPHSAIRYRAAVGIRSIHTKVVGDRSAARTVLSALARAGAGEAHELVIRAIYEAVDFKKTIPSAQIGDECASALCDIFAGRLGRLARGSRDEWIDASGFEAAGRCFSDALDSRKRVMVERLFGFLEFHVARYVDKDTTAEYVPTLVRTTQTLERVLRDILRTANANAPSSLAAAAMAPNRSESAAAAVRKALSEWKSALNKSPWPLQ